MRKKTKKSVRVLGILLMLTVALPMLPTTTPAQMQQWFQEERARQAYQQQQWLQWQRQEQIRQMQDRQQLLQWQQQEQARQLQDRQQALQWQLQERLRLMYGR
jgi:ABC-type transport system involved in cytochrome bd biosynthesis fused ATPase/permease subunit